MFPGHPATAINTVTGWLDGSQIYGSDAATAASLRTADGHMKMSEGDNLPIVDSPQGPAFAAGDVRAQENPDLTALQVLFVREHNYQVDRLQEEHPNWSGDRLYETAKAITTAEMVNITYSEFLPHLLGEDAIKPYHGYDPTVDPRITEEFAGAAYRFGHSIVSDEISAISNLGDFTSEQTLAESFFENPATFAATGADGLLRHLSGDLANPLDAHIVDGLRNFLVDPPDGMDLAAINIQRGHDLGLGTLNQTREALGLAPYTSFDQLSSDPETAAAFEKAYGYIDAVDLWAGGLAEDHAEGAIIGPTFGRIIGDQFTALRDGDRYYFENQKFDRETMKEIKSTTLSDLILRDTDTTAMQSDAFVATERHSGTLGGVDPTGEEAADGMAQLVIGSAGKDTLTGGDLDDTLVAARGRMTMTGGDGADTFVIDLDSDQGQAQHGGHHRLRSERRQAAVRDRCPCQEVVRPSRRNIVASRQRDHRLAGRKAERIAPFRLVASLSAASLKLSDAAFSRRQIYGCVRFGIIPWRYPLASQAQARITHSLPPNS